MNKLIAKIALGLLKLLDEESKKTVLTEAVKHLFSTVSAEDILRELPDGSYRFEDKTLPSAYKKDLKEQAKLFNNLLLWRVLQKDIQYQINRKMFIEGRIPLDMIWGQLLLWLNDVINTRLKNLSK